MKIRALMIDNFRGITHVSLRDLRDTIVIAGPNGCGKSSIFDAIKLWKTVYGTYWGNELQSWFGEHGINPNSEGIGKAIQNKSLPMSIYAELEISEPEKQWLNENVKDVLRIAAFRRRLPDHPMMPIGRDNFRQAELDERLRPHIPGVEAEIGQQISEFQTELSHDHLIGSVICDPDGSIKLTPSRVLSTLFSVYSPEVVGKFEYHGPQRTYGREQIGSINLQVEQHRHQRLQHSMYNTMGKYNTVKAELAMAYIRDLITGAAAAVADDDSATHTNLVQTVSEMFQKFFPGKSFLGVVPKSDGSLSFDVRTAIGDHDLDELSSGEKELIYGYLRIKNEAPKNSIIMLDEPELHLNPRLTQGLPDFYHRHIGQALNNQLWLVTHSDSILRQSVEHPDFSVYHMLVPGTYEGEDQAIPLSATDELERAIFDLVGDLAAFKPNSKIVFVEGGGGSRFDEGMIRDLFPDFSQKVNIVSAGNKARVRATQAILDQAHESGYISAKIYAITDRDDELSADTVATKMYSWDRYHIENYLLEERYILEALKRLRVRGADGFTEAEIQENLRAHAAETLNSLVRHELEQHALMALRAGIKVGSNRDATFSSLDLRALIETSLDRIAGIAESDLSLASLTERHENARLQREQSLAGDSWKKEFRGRDILKRFAGEYVGPLASYEGFRNIIITCMKDDSFEPKGMKTVLSEIMAD